MPAEDPESLPPHCSAWSVYGGAPPKGKVKSQVQPTSSQEADVQYVKEVEQDGTGTEDVFCKPDFMLAPSSFACEYDPHVEPDKLADMYTGQTHIFSPVSISQARCPVLSVSLRQHRLSAVLRVCMPACRSACLPVCLPACVHACLSTSLSVCVSAKAVCPLFSLFRCLVMWLHVLPVPFDISGNYVRLHT